MALIDAIKRGDTLEQIREQGLINEDGCLEADDLGATPLHCALERGDGDLARTLIEECPDLAHKPTGKGETPLIYATKCQLPGIVELLLEHQADPNVQTSWGHVALFTAAIFLNFNLIKLLIAAGAHLNMYTDTGHQIMHFAAQGITEQEEEHEEVWGILQYLHEQGADPNAVTEMGEQPADILYNFDGDYGNFYTQTIGAVHGSG